MNKIALIGPVFPYKGGIATFTYLIYKAIASKYHVDVISYKRQYPKMLYPGKEQKDYSDEQFKIEGTQYLIDTINPFNWFKVFKFLKNENYDLIIVQWWNPFFSLSYTFILFLLNFFSKTRTKLLYICHNIIPHESFPLGKLLTKMTLSLGNYAIVLSLAEEQNFKLLLPKKRVLCVPHPIYEIYNNKQYDFEEERKKLDLTVKENVLLFFGFVRKYKGLEYIIRALPKVIPVVSNIVLIIAGDFYEDKDKYVELIQYLDLSDYVKIYSEYVPDEEVGKFFISSDIVVLPYTSATQSGIVQIAYGFDKPVLVTNVGGLSEVVINNETGYIIEPMDCDALAACIIDFFNHNRLKEFQYNVQTYKANFSWDKMVEGIEKLYDIK